MHFDKRYLPAAILSRSLSHSRVYVVYYACVLVYVYIYMCALYTCGDCHLHRRGERRSSERSSSSTRINYLTFLLTLISRSRAVLPLRIVDCTYVRSSITVNLTRTREGRQFPRRSACTIFPHSLGKIRRN